MYTNSESFEVTIENFKREYMNAKTPYDQWKVFDNLTKWVETQQEINYYLEQRIQELSK